MRKSRRRSVVIAITMLAVAGGALYLLLPPWQTAAVAVPPDDATPEQVVTAYLAALDAHDCGTAELLTTPSATRLATAWCDDVAHLSQVLVGAHLAELPEWSGHSPHKEVVQVPVTFDLDWRWLHDDGSMPEGTTIWGYRVARDSADAPWRIVDHGPA